MPFKENIYLRQTAEFLFRHRYFFGLLLFAFILRLPYIFVTSSSWISFTSLGKSLVAIHDEGAFLYQGREVLQGFLPYERAWDNRSPFGWYVFALVTWLTAPNLWTVRVVALLLVSATAYIVYHAGRKYGSATALSAAGLYILLASTFHSAQSLSYDHFFSLFLSIMLYYTLNFDGSRKHLLMLCLFFTAGCQLFINGIILGAAITLILACHKIKNPVKNIRQFVQYMLFYGTSLLSAVLLSFFILWVVYALNDLDNRLYMALFEAPMFIAGKEVESGLFYTLFKSIAKFSDSYYTMLTDSRYWLLPALVIIAIAHSIYSAAYGKLQYPELFILLIFSLLTVIARGPALVYYSLQILPVICLAAAALIPAKQHWRLIMIVMVAAGSLALSMPVIKTYALLLGINVEYDKHRFLKKRDLSITEEPILAERGDVYKIVDIIRKSGSSSPYIFVCGMQTELYFMTNKLTPSYSPSYLNNDIIKLTSPYYGNTPLEMVMETKPQFILEDKYNYCSDIKKFLHLNYKKPRVLGMHRLYELKAADQ